MTGNLEEPRLGRQGKMVASLVVPMLLLVFRLQVVSPSPYAVSDKCAACRAVAVELEVELANERPRNHLDLRYRLDSKGQREGKVIDYRVSELRAVELLDGLCNTMKKYTMNMSSGRETWTRAEGVEHLPDFDRQAAEAHSKAMLDFCGRLLETIDEELTKSLRNGEVTVGGVETVLCSELTRHCKLPSKQHVDKDEL